jgi:hypothetical protein
MTVWRGDWTRIPIVFTWCSFCGDHHTRHADQSVLRIQLPPVCVPCDQGCTHQTLVALCVINSLSYSFISTSFCNSVQHTHEHNQLPNCINHFGTQCSCLMDNAISRHFFQYSPCNYVISRGFPWVEIFLY